MQLIKQIILAKTKYTLKVSVTIILIYSCISLFAQHENEINTIYQNQDTIGLLQYLEVLSQE